MLRRVFCKLLLAAIVIFSLLVLSDAVMAQGRSSEAFKRVKEVQERHTKRLIAIQDIEGTAIGRDQNGQLGIKIFTARRGVAGIPKTLDGVPVQVVVSGKIYAFKPPKDRPPKPPRVLTATAINENTIDLNWKDNREPDLDHYNVYWSETPGGAYKWLASASVSDYTDTDLTPNETYYYVVTAVNTSEKESGYSNEASATTEGGVVLPPAAPSDLDATAVSSSQINLTWTDNSDNETGFSIESLIGGSFWEIATVGADVTAYSDTGLTASTNYTYRVCAYNSVDDSGYAGPVSAETFAETEVPIDPRDRFDRPVPIGVSTGHADVTAGTIGCRVRDAQGNFYALSNNHVYANENMASIGDNVLQPGTYDGGVNPDDKIGTLAAFVPIDFGMFGFNTVDAAIALSSTAELGKSTPMGIGGGYGIPGSTTADAYVDQPVQKYGRTTGLTTGTITGINGNFLVRYSRSFAIFYNQIVIEQNGFSGGGDSGSLIVTNDDDCNPVGLLFAGGETTTIANPIDDVLSTLGVTIDGE